MMPEGKLSRMDRINLMLTGASLAISVLAVGVGVYVSYQVGSSADKLSKNGLAVTTATFLLDDKFERQRAGVEIVYWLNTVEQVELPAWTRCLISQIQSQAQVRAPTASATDGDIGNDDSAWAGDNADAGWGSECNVSGVAAAAAKPAAPEAPAVPLRPLVSQQVANDLFNAAAGSKPRLFIQIADESQRAGADAMRRALRQVQLSGQNIITPGIERVKHAPTTVELRFLVGSDSSEAHALAGTLTRLLGLPVTVVDKSPKLAGRHDIKPHTYELWFPADQTISLAKTSS